MTDQPGKNHIHEKEIKAEEDRGDNHYDRRAVNLVPRRPGDFFQFGLGVLKEIDKALVPPNLVIHGLSSSSPDSSRRPGRSGSGR
jgi:hypothetical protein